MSRKLMITTVFTLVALLLVACGGGAASPTQPAGGGDTGALNQTVTSTDNTLTVRYPDGWFANPGMSQVTLANDESLLADNFNPEALQAGQAAIAVSAFPASAMPPGPDGQPMGMRGILDLMSSEAGEGVELQEPEEFTVNGRSAASITGTENGRTQTVIVTQDSNNNFILVVSVGDQANVARAIAGSAEYDSAAMTLPGDDTDVTVPTDVMEPTEEATPES